MLSSLEIELGDTIFGAGQDDLGRIYPLDIGSHTNRHLGIDGSDRLWALGQINDEQLFVVDVLRS